MATATIRVRAVRAYCALGRIFLPGDVHSFDPLTAADIVVGGRGEYVDAAAAERVRAAVQADAERSVGTLRRQAANADSRRGYFQ